MNTNIEKELKPMPRNSYTSEFKTKIVLEVLKEEKELNAIAAKNNLNPNMIRNWRAEFLEKASTIFQDSEKAAKDAKRKEVFLEKKNATMLKKIGELTLERDFLQDCFRQCNLPIPEFGKEEQ